MELSQSTDSSRDRGGRFRKICLLHLLLKSRKYYALLFDVLQLFKKVYSESNLMRIRLILQDGGNLLVAVDEGSEHTMSVWDWARSERGSKITETKCATETVIPDSRTFKNVERGTII